MLKDKERRAIKRRTADLDIHFAIADRSDDYTARIENVSGGGMLLKSDTALRAGDVIHIRSAKGIPTDALLAWGKACTVKVVYCRKGGNQEQTGYGIGVHYHSSQAIHDGPHIPGPDSAVLAPVGSVTIDKHGKIISNVYLVDGIKVIRSYIRDITRRKRAYEALEKKEKEIRSLVESSMDWTWEVNEKGEYTYASPQVESVLGYMLDWSRW